MRTRCTPASSWSDPLLLHGSPSPSTDVGGGDGLPCTPLIIAGQGQQAVTDGHDVHRTPADTGAALLQSLALGGPLATGNRPFALAASLALMGLLDAPAGIGPEATTVLVTDIVSGRVEGIPEIAAALRGS